MRGKKSIGKDLFGTVLVTCVWTALVVEMGAVVLQVISFLMSSAEAGYGDSYVLYDVMHFASSGRLFRSAAEPPYTLTLYGPLLYYFLSLTVSLTSGFPPFFGPRVLVIGSYVACCVAVYSLTKFLTRSQRCAILALLLPSAVSFFGDWAGQLRADFPGTLLGLISIRLLVSENRRWFALAGAIAGAALLFKYTFVSVATAAVLWFVWRRRISDAAVFACGVLVIFIGGYFVVSLFEPNLLRHLVPATSPVIDNSGAYDILRALAREPVVALAAGGMMMAVRLGRRWRWSLVAMCSAVSLLVAVIICRQAGANNNYFIEGLFLATPFAAVALGRVMAELSRPSVLRPVLVFLLVVAVAEPVTLNARSKVRRIEREIAGERDAAIQRIVAVLSNRTVFSEITLYGLSTKNVPLLTESYLAHYLEISGLFDPAPVAQALRRGDFEIVITRRTVTSYRGIEHLSPRLREAINATYAPFCTYLDAKIYLKPASTDTGLKNDLDEMGCAREGV